MNDIAFAGIWIGCESVTGPSQPAALALETATSETSGPRRSPPHPYRGRGSLGSRTMKVLVLGSGARECRADGAPVCEYVCEWD